MDNKNQNMTLELGGIKMMPKKVNIYILPILLAQMISVFVFAFLSLFGIVFLFTASIFVICAQV